MPGRREQNMKDDSNKQDLGHTAVPPTAPAGNTEPPVFANTEIQDFAHTEVQDFANTEVLERQEPDPRWWSESTDGRCSESAALFAASQPAPLTVV